MKSIRMRRNLMLLAGGAALALPGIEAGAAAASLSAARQGASTKSVKLTGATVPANQWGTVTVNVAGNAIDTFGDGILATTVSGNLSITQTAGNITGIGAGIDAVSTTGNIAIIAGSRVTDGLLPLHGQTLIYC